MREGVERIRDKLPGVKVIGATLTSALGSTSDAHGLPEEDEKRKALNDSSATMAACSMASSISTGPRRTPRPARSGRVRPGQHGRRARRQAASEPRRLHRDGQRDRPAPARPAAAAEAAPAPGGNRRHRAVNYDTLYRQDRDPHGRGLAAADHRHGGHARGAAPGIAAAALALDVVSGLGAAGRTRAGWPPAPGRVPAAGTRPAAPDVGGWAHPATRAAARGGAGHAHQHDFSREGEAGRQRAARVRDGPARDRRPVRPGDHGGAGHRLSRHGGGGGEGGDARLRPACAGRGDQPGSPARPGAAVPLLRADRKRAPDSLRHGLRARGRGLPGVDRAWPAAGDLARRVVGGKGLRASRSEVSGPRSTARL